MKKNYRGTMVLTVHQIVILWTVLNSCAGMKLTPCINGTADIPELTSASLTCEDTSGSVWWKTYHGSSARTVAVCNSTYCSMQNNNSSLSITRPNSTASVLSFSLIHHRDHNVRFVCLSTHMLSCTVRSVHTSTPTNCKFDVNSQAMRVSGRCDVKKVYSSDGKYVCRWMRRYQETTTVINGTFSLTSFTDTSTSLTYMTGTCSFSSTLFVVNGEYSFSIHTSPGSDMHVATVNIMGRSNMTLTGPEVVDKTVSSGTGGIRTIPCKPGPTLDAQEGSLVALSCHLNYGNEIQWEVYYYYSTYTLSTCNTTQCSTDTTKYEVMATRVNETDSILFVDLTSFRDYPAQFTCSSNSWWSTTHCLVQSVYPSAPSNCRFDVVPENGTVTGECEISKIFSNQGTESCTWTERYKEQTERAIKGTLTLSSFIDPTNGRTYKSGTCSFTCPFFALEGMFTYRVSINPGVQEYIATVDVDKAFDLTVSGGGHLDSKIPTSDTALELYTCYGNNVVNIKLGTRIGLICQDTMGTVRWTLSSYRYGSPTVATCNTTQCTMEGGHTDILATRPNASTSLFYISMWNRNTAYVQCGSRGTYYCSVRLYYASPPTDCRFNVDADNMTVSGSCDVAELYNSDNTYKCQLVVRDQRNKGTVVDGQLSTTIFTKGSGQLGFRRGVCSFSSFLIMVDGQYNYTLQFIPGSEMYLATLYIEEQTLSLSGAESVNASLTGSPTPSGTRIYPCDNYQKVDVEEGIPVGLNCSGLVSYYNANWQIKTTSYYYYSNVASCNTTFCTVNNGYEKKFLATRPHDTYSILYVSATDLGSQFQCRGRRVSSCSLRSVYTSGPINCEFQVDADDMKVSGRCDVEKIYTSDNSYDCKWIYRQENETESTMSGSFIRTSLPDFSSSKHYYNGSCSFSASFFSVQGLSTYSIRISPGVEKHIASLDIDEYGNITLTSASDVDATMTGVPKGLKTYVCQGNTVDIELDSQAGVFCPSTYDNVKWNVNSYYTNLASCNSTQCTMSAYSSYSKNMLVVRSNSTSTLLYVNMQVYRNSGLRVYCGRRNEHWCYLRSVYSSQPTNCMLDVNADLMVANGSCEIPKMYTSDSTYNCRWILQYEDQTQVQFSSSSFSALGPPGYPTMGLYFKNGTCSFSSPVFLFEGVSTFIVHVSPGIPLQIATLTVDEHSNFTLEGAEGVEVTVMGHYKESEIYNCTGNRILDVQYGIQVGLFCDKTYPSVSWTTSDQPPSYTYYHYHTTVSTCNRTHCTARAFSDDLMATRPDSTSTILYVNVRQFHNSFKKFSCMESCFIRPVYPASPTNCRFDVSADTMTVSGSCDVDKVFSSDGKISCTWVEQFQNKTTKYINGTFPLVDIENENFDKDYKTGTCSFSSSLFMVNGTFNYSIHVRPGEPKHIATLYLDGPSNITLRQADDVEATTAGAPADIHMFRCRNGSTVDIPEYTQAGLVCEVRKPDYKVRWMVKAKQKRQHPPYHAHRVNSTAVICNSSLLCEVPDSHKNLLVARPNKTTSVLYINMVADRDIYKRVECYSPTLTFCLIRAVHTSVPSNCRFDFDTHTNEVSGSCDVVQIFSSDGRYKCEWLQQYKGRSIRIGTTTFPLKSYRDPRNGLPYKFGTCSFSSTLLLLHAGQYRFSVHVSPGSPQYIATLDVDTHSDPQISLTGAAGVNTTIDGIPTEVPTTTTTAAPTESPSTVSTETTSEDKQKTTHGHDHSTWTSRPRSSSPTSEGQADQSKMTAIVAGGVGGGVGVIIIVAIIIIGVLVLRKLSGNQKASETRDSDDYFYGSSLRSDSFSEASSTVSIIGSSTNGSRNSSSL